jgi:hypothetical protein
MPKPPTAYQDAYIKTALRLPSQMRDQLLADARHNGRSLNNEILTRIQLSQDMRLANVERELQEMKVMLRKLLDAAG